MYPHELSCTNKLKYNAQRESNSIGSKLRRNKNKEGEYLHRK